MSVTPEMAYPDARAERWPESGAIASHSHEIISGYHSGKIMFFTEEKLNQRVDEVASYRFREPHMIEQAEFIYDREGRNGEQLPGEHAGWQSCDRGFRWQERDIYVWLKLRFDFPAAWRDQTIVGQFNFSLGAEKLDYEALLYIDGLPYQGIDQNHTQVVMPAEFAGKTVEFSFRIWSGILEGKIRKHFQAFHVGNAFNIIQFCLLDDATDRLFYTTRAILQTLQVLGANDPFRSRLLGQVDLAYQRIDWCEPGDEAFYQSLAVAADFLDEAYPQIDKSQHPVTVHCVGHTHIDLAFLWQLKHTREKCARSFSTVLRLMERYPEYTFFQSQPQLYDYVRQDYPDLYRQIKQRVAEGRWEVDGAMWVEADCNLPSGESFVRQILLGSQFMQDEFGITPCCLWLPDVFGYSWALPQILKKCGIRYFMTTKISWNEFNQMPHDTFTWRGIDGSEVLAHFITTPEEGYPRYTYNGMVNAASVQGIWDNYKDQAINQELLLAYGYGDGGGGPTDEMLELLRRFEKMPALPQIKMGRVDDFFQRLDVRLTQNEHFSHTWDGELYFESHRGTYTSQAQVKRANRLAELLYRRMEWFQTLAVMRHGDWSEYCQQALTDGWKILLRNQFHDIIPGSSIAEVYTDAAAEYRDVDSIAQHVLTESRRHLIEERPDAFSIINSAAWQRSDLVFIAGNGLGSWRDGAGQRVPFQANGQGWWVSVSDMPPLTGATLYHDGLLALSVQPTPFIVGAQQVETPFYLIEWNEHGQLTRIFDRDLQREVLTDVGNVLTVYEDKPLKYDAWDIEIFYYQKQRPLTQLISVEVIEQGTLICVIEFVWRYHNSQIVQKLQLYSQQRRIDFATRVDWQEFNQLLRVNFPVAVRATEATYDIQFGNVKRPTTWNTSWDYARFESVAHQWADLSEYGFGVSLLNDCKYGHAIKDNVMQMTLIKSAVSPDAHADRGLHQFTYALLPHAGDWRDAQVVQQAFYLNEPLQVMPGAWLEPAVGLVSYTNPFVQLDALKKAERGEWLIVRLHEFSGGRQSLVLNTLYPIEWWAECDLLERPETRQSGEAGPLTLSFSPYEIKTIALCLSRH